MSRPDVLVVGAGIAGCSVAAHLATDHRVVLLEQANAPGAEATAQNAGMVRRLVEDPWARALSLRTAARLATLDEEWAELAPSRRTGAVLALAFDPDHLADGVAHLRARGVRVEACDRPAEVAPVLDGSHLERCWYVPDERVADPHALVTGFLRIARRHGVVLRTGVRVEALELSGDRVTGVLTDQGVVAAGAVVLAAGAWCGALAARHGLERPLFPLRRHLLQTASSPLSASAHPWTWVDDAGVYVRPEAGGWLTSGCDEVVDPPPPGPGSTGPVEELGRALVVDKARRYLPALGDLRFVRGWTGLRTFTPDRRPLLGADGELDGLWWAAGLGGSGVSASFAVGEALAAWMRGEVVAWLANREGVRPDRPHLARWPIRPTGSIGATTLISGRPLAPRR